ncbi:MAG: molecular chaperone [Candidatus Methanofastidiosia archaeon]
MNIANLARLRQGCYRLFGALFLYPDKERLTTLLISAEELEKESESLEAFPFFESLKQLLTTLHKLAEGEMLEVEEEYISLFMVNPKAPPYESFYIDPQRQNTGWIAVQLEREYAEKGLVLSPSLGELPDHAAVELEFMSFLCRQEFSALEKEALQDLIHVLKQQHAFLVQHLDQWFNIFAKRVKGMAQKRFYGVLVEATNAFIHNDLVLLNLLIEEVQEWT